MNVSSGSATNPVSRSMTTDAKATSPVPVVLTARLDPQHVATDGRRQHVADELAGEVVREQGAQRHVHVEHREHPLPAPRREHEPDEGEREPGGEERERADVGVLRLDVVGGDLGDEERQQRGAHDDPEAELGRSREPQVAPLRRARQPCREPPFPHVTGSFTELFARARRLRPVQRRRTDDRRDGRRRPARRAGPVRGARPAPGARASAVPRRTSPTMSTRSRTTTGGHVRPPRARRERPSRRPRRVLPRPARGRRAGRRRRHSASTICGCSATRWAGWWCGGSCSRRRSGSPRSCSWTPRPARRRARPRARGLRGGGRPDQRDGRAAGAVRRARPAGLPAYQRVLAERPGFREYADYKWSARRR